MRVFIVNVLYILGVALACGVLVNAVRPRGAVSWVEDWSRYVEARAITDGISIITLVEALDIVKARSHVVLDARPRLDYTAGHLPGALSLPFEPTSADFDGVSATLTPEQPILTYCSGKDCDESLLLAQWLRARGFTNVVIFATGYEKWQQTGQAIERSETP